MTALHPSKYSDEQRAAIVAARERGDTGVRVAQLAKSGHLRNADGRRIPKFRVPEATVRDIHRRERKRRAREATDVDLADRPPRDAIELLRRSLLEIAQVELRRMRKRQRATKGVTWPEISQLARAVNDLARLPGPLDPRPPGENAVDPRTGLKGVVSRSGEAGSLLKAHRNGPPGVLPAQAAGTAHRRRAADFEPTPVDDEQAEPINPGALIAEELRAEIERAASRDDA